MTLSTKPSLLKTFAALLRVRKIRHKYSITKTRKLSLKAARVKLIKAKESEEFVWLLTRFLIVTWQSSNMMFLDDIVCYFIAWQDLCTHSSFTLNCYATNFAGTSITDSAVFYLLLGKCFVATLVRNSIQIGFMNGILLWNPFSRDIYGG